MGDTGLTARTRDLWEERLGRPLANEELLEIIDNMTEFARILIDWFVTDSESCGRFWAETSVVQGACPSRRE